MTKEDELFERARELAAQAASWADLSNDLFAPGTGLLTTAFPDVADRRAFRDTPQYREVVGLVKAAIDRFGLVEGATPRRTGRREEGGESRPREATITYRNHRGVTAVRRILPRAIRYGSSEWHPKPQWLLDALDVDKGEERTFAMRDVLEWGT